MVELIVGAAVGVPLIVRVTVSVIPPVQLNATVYTAPRRASASTVAMAAEPGAMVTVSKMPAEAVAVLAQPGALSVTRPPGATSEGDTTKSPGALARAARGFGAGAPSAAKAAGAARARAAAPSRAVDAARIARMVNPPGPEGQPRKGVSAKDRAYTSIPDTLGAHYHSRDPRRANGARMSLDRPTRPCRVMV